MAVNSTKAAKSEGDPLCMYFCLRVAHLAQISERFDLYSCLFPGPRRSRHAQPPPLHLPERGRPEGREGTGGRRGPTAREAASYLPRESITQP